MALARVEMTVRQFACGAQQEAVTSLVGSLRWNLRRGG